MAAVADEALACMRLSGAVGRTWNAICINEEAMEEIQEQKLFEKFNRLLGNECVPEGTRTDYFLSANPTVIMSFQNNSSRTLTPMWEASSDTSKPHRSDYPCLIAVLTHSLFATAYPTILTEQPHPSETIHCVTGEYRQQTQHY